MARIIYSLSGQGRGHTSRVMAISTELRARGHDVMFCCGGMAHRVLQSAGENLLHVPALKHDVEGNRIRVLPTLRANLPAIRSRAAIIDRLATAFRTYGPDLVISDFEAFSPLAAARAGVSVLSFNHQEVLTETGYDLPTRYWLEASMARLAVRMIAPQRPRHVLISSFFFPPLKHPERATLIPPIIRPAVQAAKPTSGEHVLVYFTESAGTERVATMLGAIDAPFILYNVEAPERPDRFPNLTFKEPSLDGFLEDLASCRAVLCTAGFTLISEALYLGKPMMVMPNGGVFEQTLNALFLERGGLGEAVIGRPVVASDIVGFMSRLGRYRSRIDGHRTCGNEQAIECIEACCGPQRWVFSVPTGADHRIRPQHHHAAVPHRVIKSPVQLPG